MSSAQLWVVVHIVDQRTFCICKPWSSPQLAFPWTSRLCPHYIGRTRLFGILRRMNTQLALDIWHVSYPTAMDTCNEHKVSEQEHTAHGIPVQHTWDSQACPNVSECLYVFHRACTFQSEKSQYIQSWKLFRLTFLLLQMK